MALDSAKFMEVQKRAKKIMEMDRNGQLDKYNSKNSGELLENGDINFEPITELRQNQVPSAMENPYPTVMPSNNINTRMPKEILESFQKNQIDTNKLEVSSSVLDTLGVPNIPQAKKKVIKETTEVIPSQSQVQSNITIDYSLIKTIVEDCMRKSISSLKKTMLTENKETNQDNNLALLKIGESFKFVTSSGDIYEARLVKKGNINERKK